MSEKNSMTRREALKKMGVVAAGIGLGIGGVHATDVLGLFEKEEKQEKSKESCRRESGICPGDDF